MEIKCELKTGIGKNSGKEYKYLYLPDYDITLFISKEQIKLIEIIESHKNNTEEL